MDDFIDKYLCDILTAIKEVESFMVDSVKSYNDFSANLQLRRAVERNIEIIGEATNRILKAQENFPITNARKIIDARNRVAHGYDTLSLDILWSIVINHLPKLKEEVGNFLEK